MFMRGIERKLVLQPLLLGKLGSTSGGAAAFHN
jgi:hypothetical protein